MKDLNRLGVIELEEFSICNTNGGCGGFCISLVTGLIVSAVDHWSDIKKGVRDAIADA